MEKIKTWNSRNILDSIYLWPVHNYHFFKKKKKKKADNYNTLMDDLNVYSSTNTLFV